MRVDVVHEGAVEDPVPGLEGLGIEALGGAQLELLFERSEHGFELARGNLWADAVRPRALLVALCASRRCARRRGLGRFSRLHRWHRGWKGRGGSRSVRWELLGPKEAGRLLGRRTTHPDWFSKHTGTLGVPFKCGTEDKDIVPSALRARVRRLTRGMFVDPEVEEAVTALVKNPGVLIIVRDLKTNGPATLRQLRDRTKLSPNYCGEQRDLAVKWGLVHVEDLNARTIEHTITQRGEEFLDHLYKMGVLASGRHDKRDKRT